MLLGSVVQGQQSNCFEAAGISTNPADPVNSQCDGDFLNTFDWMQDSFAVNFNCVNQPLPNVLTPFRNPWTSNTEYLADNPIPDYLPEDGWELLSVTNATDHLSIILYNRYTSIIRVLSNLPRCLNDFASLEMSLGFDSRREFVTGLLATSGAYTQTMDEPSIPQVSTLHKWPSTADHFMYMDYQVEYDPCTCNHDKENDLEIKFLKLDTASIDMVGRMTSMSSDLATVDEHGFLNLEGDYLTSIMQQGSGAADGVGTHVFSSWNKAAEYYDTLQAQVSAHQEQYKAFYTLSNILGLATDEGGNFTKGLKQLDEDIIGGLGYDLLNSVKYVGKVASTGLGILNIVSAGVNVLGAPIKKKGEALQAQVNSLGQVQMSQSEIALTGVIQLFNY